MFAQQKDYYRVEESSMEEFLQAIERQKSKSSQFESSKINHLEKKFLESFSKNKK